METFNAHNDTAVREGIVTGVVRIVGLEKGIALVEPESKSGCSSCSMAKGCGTKMVAGYFSRNMQPLKIANEFDGNIGDRIEVGMENATILKLSAVIYLLPLLGMIFAAIFVDTQNVSDLAALIFSCFGLLVGFVASKWVYGSSYISNSVALIYFSKLKNISNAKSVDAECEVRT